MSTEPREWEFKALTAIWTGDVNGKAERLITTGLLGSIRWWFEVLVRGFGGVPCDPSNSKCIDREHCVVCELFGCTGWARKFRFDVLDENSALKRDQIQAGDTFKLCFTPLRHICDEEWALLDLTLRLIADYGAIGGKTVYKPSEEKGREGARHHQDYGLVDLVDAQRIRSSKTGEDLRAYVGSSKWLSAPQQAFAWASVTNLWSVPGRYLARQSKEKSSFNRVIDRKETKGESKRPSADSWLAGRGARINPKVDAESKKVFSFKSHPRTLGFVNPNGGVESVTLSEIKKRLEAAWQRTIVTEAVAEGNTGKIQLLTGSEILDRLLRAQEETS